jgi:cytochrome c-type biogenesis protein CcmE
VMASFKDSTIYSKGIDQLVAEKSKWVGRTVRVEGTLVRGTLRFREKPCEYQFDATRGGATIHVKYASCIKPDTLRDDMPEVGVTAEGKLTDGGDFIATNVLAKCPSKYEMKDKAQKGYPGAENGAPPPPPSVTGAGAPGGPPAALP